MSTEHQQLTDKIRTIVRAYKELDAVVNTAVNCGMLDPEGPMWRAIWNTFETMLALVDQDDWISWYIYENQCGAKGHPAGVGEYMRPIRTTKQLATLMLQTKP